MYIYVLLLFLSSTKIFKYFHTIDKSTTKQAITGQSEFLVYYIMFTDKPNHTHYDMVICITYVIDVILCLAKMSSGLKKCYITQS